MAAIIPALVTPRLLTWAREEAGYSSIELAAEATGFSVEKLRAWEQGEAQPTLRQAEHLAKVYHRPFSVFLLSQPPKTTSLAAEYRRLPGVQPNAESPALRFAIREMMQRRKVALNLLAELDSQPIVFALKARLSDPPEELAAAVRAALNVSMEDQLKWPDEFKAWREWRAAVEQTGVLVFQFSTRYDKVSLDEARGIALLHAPLPVIGVNSSEIPLSKPFTLLHELIHLALANAKETHTARDEKRSTQEWQAVERFVERVAGAIAMPLDAIASLPAVAQGSISDGVSIDEARKMARRLKVTPSALMTRLLALQLISPVVYRRWRDAWDVYQANNPPKPGFAVRTPSQKALSRHGKPFTLLVLEALSTERITSADASRHLGIGFDHVEKLRQEFAYGQPYELEIALSQ